MTIAVTAFVAHMRYILGYRTHHARVSIVQLSDDSVVPEY